MAQGNNSKSYILDNSTCDEERTVAMLNLDKENGKLIGKEAGIGKTNFDELTTEKEKEIIKNATEAAIERIAAERGVSKTDIDADEISSDEPELQKAHEEINQASMERVLNGTADYTVCSVQSNRAQEINEQEKSQ